MLIRAAQSLLLLVDLQERLVPAIAGGAEVLERCRTLLEVARRLDVPVAASEQYPQGLGPTVPALATLLRPGETHAKTHFGCADDPALWAALERHGRDQVVLAGTEAHVCVLQSALGLHARGLRPVVVADAVGARRPADRDLALTRMRAAGVVIASSEMVIFEWLGRAATPEFRAVLPLIR